MSNPVRTVNAESEHWFPDPIRELTRSRTNMPVGIAEKREREHHVMR